MATKEKLVKQLPQDRIDGSKVITIANHKGGCGKTTTAISLGMYYVRSGLNILFIDADAQHNLTTRMGIDDGTFQNERIDAVLTSAVKRKAEKLQMKYSRLMEYPYIYRADTDTVVKIGEIGIIPGDVSVVESANGAASKLAGVRNAPTLNGYFQQCINEYRNYYDRIIIDTAPSLSENPMTVAAVQVSDEIICPVDSAEAALGLYHFVTWVDRKFGSSSVDRPGIIFASVKYYNDPESVTGETTDTLHNAVHQILKHTFKDSVCNNGVLEQVSLKRNLSMFGRKSAYTELCQEIEDLIKSGRKNNPFNTTGSAWDAMQEELDIIITQARNNKTPTIYRPVYDGINGR